MAEIVANHPQVANRPLQVRRSSQPIGLRSSFRCIHFRRKDSQNTGVRNVSRNHTSLLLKGCSDQERAIFLPASSMATTSPKVEKAPNRAVIQRTWLTEKNACNAPQVPSKFVKTTKPTSKLS